MIFRANSTRLAFAALACLVAAGCSKSSRRGSEEYLAPDIDYIFHCTAEEHDFSSNFDWDRDLHEQVIFNNVYSYRLEAQPAGPVSGGLFAANPGPLGDGQTVVIYGTNFDPRTTLTWVASDTTDTSASGALSLSDMNGTWVSENILYVVPPPSPLAGGDGYVDIVAQNPSQSSTSDEFEGVDLNGHAGAWLYVEEDAFTVTAVSLGSKLPSNMLLAPGVSGIWVNVTVANSTTDDMRIDAVNLSFTTGSTNLDSFVNAYADYRDDQDDSEQDGLTDSDRLTVRAGSTATVPFLLNLSHDFPTANSATDVSAAVSASAVSVHSKGEFAATLAATALFRVAPTPVISTNGNDAYAASASSGNTGFSGGHGGDVTIGNFDGTLSFGSGSASVSAPSVSGSAFGNTAWDNTTSFPSTLIVSSNSTFEDDLTGSDYIDSDTVLVTATVTSELDSNDSAYDLQFGSSGDPCELVVFNGADFILVGGDDGNGLGGQETYAGNGGSLAIHTERFVCVDSNIDLRAGDIAGGPFTTLVVGQTGSFSVTIYEDNACQFSGSTFDLRGANSSGVAAGNGGNWAVTAATGTTDVDVVVVNCVVNTTGGNSYGYSVDGLPAHVGASFSSDFFAGNGGSATISEAVSDALGDITIIGNGSFILEGGYAATLNDNNSTVGGSGGSFLISGGNNIVIATSAGTPGVSTGGGSAGIYGGFGDNTSNGGGYAGSAGGQNYGSSSESDDLTLASGCVLAAIGGNSDSDPSGSGSGGDIYFYADEGTITLSGYVYTQGGFAREDEDGGTDAVCGDGGFVGVYADEDAIELTSTGVIWTAGGSPAVYGYPAGASGIIDLVGGSTSLWADVRGGGGGSVELVTDSGEGTSDDDGDITIAGWIFTHGGHSIDDASAGSAGDITIDTGDDSSTTSEGDLVVTGTLCLNGGTDFWGGDSEGNAGGVYVTVNGGSLTWSGLVEAIGDEAGELKINDTSLTEEADGDADLSGTFLVDNDFECHWFGERINFTGSIGSQDREVRWDVEFTNEVDNTAGNNETTTLAGTIWGRETTVSTEYDLVVSGTIRSERSDAFFGAYVDGAGVGSGNGDPDVSISGTIRFDLDESTQIEVYADDGGSSTESNITLTGTLVADYGYFYIGNNGTAEGDLSLNGSTMQFGFDFEAYVSAGDLTLPSGRTVTVFDGDAEFGIYDHGSTVDSELITLAGTVNAYNIYVYASNTDDDSDVTISGTLDASAATNDVWETDLIDGGYVEIDVDDVLTLTGTINASGQANTGLAQLDRHGFGGEVYIENTEFLTGNDWTLGGTINVNGGGDATTLTPGFFLEGGSGGYVSIEFIGDDVTEELTINTTITANGGASAHGPGGFGGVVAISCLDGSTEGGELTISGSISANGGSSTFTGAGYGGPGGAIFYAAGEVVVGGTTSVNGGDGPAFGGDGGNVSVTAVDDDSAGVTNPISGSGTINAAGGNTTNNGYDGNGGSIFFDNDSGVSTSTTPGSSVTTNVTGANDGTVHRENE